MLSKVSTPILLSFIMDQNQKNTSLNYFREHMNIQGKNYKLKRETHHYWNAAITKQISLHLLKLQNIAFIYLFIHPFFAGESVLGYTASGLFLPPHGRTSFSAYTSLLASGLHSCIMTLCTMCFVWKNISSNVKAHQHQPLRGKDLRIPVWSC